MRQKVSRVDIPWSPQIDGRNHDVFIRAYAPHGAIDGSSPIDLQYHPGLGQERMHARSVVRTLGAQSLNACVVMLPFETLPPTAANIERILREAPTVVSEYWAERAENGHAMGGMGYSQGGGAVIKAMAFNPDVFDVGVAMAPVGLNNDQLGHDPRSRTIGFAKRFGKNLLLLDQSLFLRPANILAGGEIAVSTVGDARRGVLSPKLDYAFSDEQDLPSQARQLVDAGRLIILAGENDPVFPGHEMRQNLGGDHYVYDMPHSHLSTLTRRGKEQLRDASGYYKIAHEVHSSRRAA